MIKLKEIIQHLDEDVYSGLESLFLKNKAGNFLCLLQAYRQNLSDSVIIDKLNVNSNSFYVLKSRLLDKIQDNLSGDTLLRREELLEKLSNIPVVSVSEPREVVIAYLQKLEKDLSAFDMHSEILIVYSALKKMFVYSDRYFHYSQLYNKHVAFNLSLEKTEDNLGTFNRVFGQYDFSRSKTQLDTLLFLRKEVSDHFSLNSSRQIEIIKNIIDLQLVLFCNTFLSGEIEVENILSCTGKLISELPEKSAQKSWAPVIDYLRFEYHLRMHQVKKAGEYLLKLKHIENTILLYSHIVPASKYFISKIYFHQKTSTVDELAGTEISEVLFDSDDFHTMVQLGIYEAMVSFYSGNLKTAAGKINTLLNENSFKDYFHINTELKFTLAYFYSEMKEYELAESMLKGIYRKIKSDKIEGYQNALDLIKVFELEIRQNGRVSQKQKDHFVLFQGRNKNENELLRHLILELEIKILNNEN